jgi:hypothetical protein
MISNREEINRYLEEYTDKNCMNCYAKITKEGLIHLDDKFTPCDYEAIIEIIAGWNGII